MQLSQGPWAYNRFDIYEGKGASNPEEMKKKVDEAGKKAKKEGKKLSKEDEKEEAAQEAETVGEGVELNSGEIGVNGMEPRMAMYSRALGRMGAHYSAGNLYEKELPEFIKKKMKEKHDEAHGKDEKKKEMKEGMKPDYLDFDKDGDKKEPMKKALKEKGMKKEEVVLTKEDVVEYLVSEGYATNTVSAEILHTHISDEFLEEIEERMIAEMGPAYPSETKAQAKAQSDHRMGKSSAGLKTGKNPGLKMSHTSGANRQA